MNFVESVSPQTERKIFTHLCYRARCMQRRKEMQRLFFSSRAGGGKSVYASWSVSRVFLVCRECSLRSWWMRSLCAMTYAWCRRDKKIHFRVRRGSARVASDEAARRRLLCSKAWKLKKKRFVNRNYSKMPACASRKYCITWRTVRSSLWNF